EDGLFVRATTEKNKAILGKRIAKIGSLPTEEAMKKLARFAAADNYMSTLQYVTRFCLNDGQLLRYIGATDSPDRITLSLVNDNGSIFDNAVETLLPSELSNVRLISMRAESKNPTPLYLSHQSDNYWFDYLSGQEAVYLQINSLNHKNSEPFGDFCNRLFDTLDFKGANKLIIDLRLCSGGDHIELPLLKGILARPHIDRSDHLFLIIGRMTGSAAQHLTSELERYTNVTLYGEPTGSKPNQYGSMQQFILPHSKMEISCATNYFQDAGPSDFSTASEPDVFVPLFSKDYKDNYDPVLDRILHFDSCKHLRPEFFTTLSEGYSSDGIDNFKRAYRVLKEKYLQYGFNLENLLYKDLDNWMGNNKKSEEEYIEYLKFIHEELPNSIPVCYDLAYWMNRIGQKEEAVRLYERCIMLNPEHHRAKMRLELIELE
ncbi:MAG: hypothetical protein V2A67_05795, partial [Bacteroidota bacterium]